MLLSSMTGFSRASAGLDGVTWQWELKSVNGKALDVRCRLPPGFDALEPQIRLAVLEKLKRGNLQVSLSVSGVTQAETVTINEAVLAQILKAGERLRARIGGEAMRADLVLAMRGVLEIDPTVTDTATLERRNAAIMASFQVALAELEKSRWEEGVRLENLIDAQVRCIAALTIAARDNPARTTEAVKARLAMQIAKLMETGASFDAARLHQEAVLLATRADIQEELDRLMSHVAAARALLDSGAAIGRKFDFLAQEFNREANTLCSKAVDQTMTAIGLDLKTVIDQMREQVQNIE